MNTSKFSVRISSVTNGFLLTYSTAKAESERTDDGYFMGSSWDEKDYVFADWAGVMDFLSKNSPVTE